MPPLALGTYGAGVYGAGPYGLHSAVAPVGNLAQPVAEYAIRVRNSSRQIVGEISQYQSATFTLRYNNVGAWLITLDANDPLADDIAADGAGIQVLRVLRDPTTGQRLSGGVLLSGPRTGRVREMQGNLLTVNGADDLYALAGLTVLSLGSYNSGTNTYADAYDTRSGAAETVIWNYVNENAVAAANDPLGLSRNVPGLTLATDLGRGSSVSWPARFDQLIVADGTGMLQQLAQSGGIGFRIVQSGTSLEFQQYVSTDKSANVIFSEAFGNLADFSYQDDAPDFSQGGNVVIVAGGGDGASRVVIVRADTASIARWGRHEFFVDARDTSDIPTLQQRGDAILAQTAASTQFACTLAPQRAVVYGQDFDIGDTVTVVIDGVSTANIVREVQITLDTQGAETVTPAIGTPNADTIRQLFGGFVQERQLASLRSTASRLARSQ